MYWTFLALSAGALAFAIKILIDHLHEANTLKAQIHKLELDQIKIEEQVVGVQGDISAAKAQAEELKLEISARQEKTTSLQAEIDSRKGEKARRGKYKVE